jgi:hypothetical protein
VRVADREKHTSKGLPAYQKPTVNMLFSVSHVFTFRSNRAVLMAVPHLISLAGESPTTEYWPSTIKPHGNKFPRQDSNLHLPLPKRSNRSLHHPPSWRLAKFAGEPTRRVDSGHDFSRYLVPRDYAPVPGTLIPGRAAALRVEAFAAKYLSSFTTGEACITCLPIPLHPWWESQLVHELRVAFREAATVA